jgi:uncharacterized phiE125 gp8 family phage protein
VTTSWVRFSAPAKEPVTLQEANDHLRIDVDDEDEQNERYLAVCRSTLENQYELAFISQTWDFYEDFFPGGLRWADNWNSRTPGFRLTRRPLQSVTSLSYTSSTGATTIMTPNVDYFASPPSHRIVPAFGKSWPATTLQPVDGIHGRVVLGYGDDPADVPEEIRHCILLLFGHLYENKEQVLLEQRIRPIDIPRGIQDMMDPFDWRIKVA